MTDQLTIYFIIQLVCHTNS